MKMAVYLVCAALVVGCRAASAEPGPFPEAAGDGYGGRVPGAGLLWAPFAADQGFYLVPDYADQDTPDPEERFKRAGNRPSLSIVNPLDVLRQRLLLEMARRQFKEDARQVAENRKLMKSVGKRGPFLRQTTHHGNAISYDNM